MRATQNLIDTNFIDARFVGANSNLLSGTYRDEAALDASLATQNAAYFTAAVLAQMTINDKVFALRNYLDAAGFRPGGTTTGIQSVPQSEEEPPAEEPPAEEPPAESYTE